MARLVADRVHPLDGVDNADGQIDEHARHLVAERHALGVVTDGDGHERLEGEAFNGLAARLEEVA